MSLRPGRGRLFLLAWDDFSEIHPNFTIYRSLQMRFRVRALYLILLEVDSLLGMFGSGMSGFKWERKVLDLAAVQVRSMWV